MTENENGIVEEQAEASETQSDELDYKAMYEAEKANAEKWKAMSRKNEAKYKEASKQPQSDNAEIAELQRQLADFRSQQQRQGWVNAALTANGLNADDAKWLTGETEESIAEAASALKARISAAPKSPDMGNVGGKSQPAMSKADIMAIKNTKERKAAIAANINLFD